MTGAMVLIELYGNTRHGMVHIDKDGCFHTRRPVRTEAPPGYEWSGADTKEAADLEFPDYTLYWCSLCFGPDNPRRRVG